MNYSEALNTLGNRTKQKLARNTYLEKQPDLTVTIRLHKTRIITYAPNGVLTLNAGGWLTPVTQNRMNDYLPDGWHIDQSGGLWYLSRRGDSGPGTVYIDGTQLLPNGTVKPTKTRRANEEAKQKAERAKVTTFCNDFIAALVAGKVPPPSGADCFLCCGLPPGGGGTPDHIQAHIRERYYVPSLLVNAMKAQNYSGDGIRYYLSPFWAENATPETRNVDKWKQARLKSSLRRYIHRQLGMVP